MFDAPEKAYRRCHAGEDDRAELWEVRFGKRGGISPDADDLVGELAAFANASAVVGWIPTLLELRESGLVVRVGGTNI